MKVHQAVIPVADALNRAAVRLKPGRDVRREAFQRHAQRIGQRVEIVFQAQKRQRDRSVADAVPVQRALEPPVIAPVGQIGLEDAPLDFLPGTLPHFRRELIAHQIERFGQCRACLRAEQVDQVRLARQHGMRAERLGADRRGRLPEARPLLLVGGQHPRRFLADAPDQVVDHGAHGQIAAQEQFEHGARQLGALQEIGVFIRAARAVVLENAIQRVGQRGDAVQIRDLRADRVQHGRRRRGSPHLLAQIGDRGGRGQPALQLVLGGNSQSISYS